MTSRGRSPGRRTVGSGAAALGLALVAPCVASGHAHAADPPRPLAEAAAEVLARGEHQTEVGTEDGALEWPGEPRGGGKLPVGVGVGDSRSKPGQKTREPVDNRREPAGRSSPSAREPAGRSSPSAREPATKREPPDEDLDPEADRRRASERDRDRELAPPERPARDPAGREASDARTVAVTIFALLGGVLAVALASALWQAWQRRRRPIPTATTSGEPAAVAGTAEPDAALDPIEALAQAGQFAEAVHALLQAATARLSATERLVVRADMTHREILRGAALERAGHGALGDIVGTVEIALFGGQPLAEGDYRRCRASFEALAAELARPAARAHPSAGGAA